MNGGDKVKIIGGFNSDLIGQVATVTGTVGSDVEVILDSRPSMRYVIPANIMTLLNPPKPTPKPTAKAVEKQDTARLITDYFQTAKDYENYIKHRILRLTEELDELKAIQQTIKDNAK